MDTPELNLQLATSWMTTISLFLLIFLGLFGCICNIIIFTSKKLKKDSCAFYFLCMTFFELSILSLGGISRLETEHFGSTFINQNQIFCKIRSYLITTMGTVATYFLLMAGVDRYMATSVHARYRAFSRRKVAYRIAAVTVLLIMIFNVHVLIFFDLQPTCIPQPGVYALFYSLYLIICASILPDGLITLFSLRTLRNIKQSRLRTTANAVVNTARQRSKQRMETQLVIMMLAQASISVSLDFTRAACYSYYFLTANNPKTPYQKLVAVFIFQFSNVLLYINYSKSFYIYTLASSLFRNIFRDIIRYYYYQLFRLLHLNHVYPLPNNRTTAQQEQNIPLN